MLLSVSYVATICVVIGSVLCAGFCEPQHRDHLQNLLVKEIGSGVRPLVCTPNTCMHANNIYNCKHASPVSITADVFADRLVEGAC